MKLSPFDEENLRLLANPELLDLYLQQIQHRAATAYARIQLDRAFLAGNAEQLRKPEKYEQLQEQVEECRRLELEAACRFSDACRVILTEQQLTWSEEWEAQSRDFFTAKATLEYACAAINDAAAAASEALGKNDKGDLRYWGEEGDRRLARFDSLRRTFYQQRVLAAPPPPSEESQI